MWLVTVSSRAAGYVVLAEQPWMEARASALSMQLLRHARACWDGAM